LKERDAQAVMNHRKHTSASRTVFVFLISCLIPVFSATAGDAAREKRVRIGLSEFPPVCQHTRNEMPAGLLPEIVRYIAGKENWQFDIATASLDANHNALASGDLDLILTVSNPLGTESPFALTRKSALSTWAHVYTSGPLSVQSLADLAGLSVGVVGGDPYNRALRNTLRRMNIACSFVEFKSYGELFQALSRHWVEAGLVDRLFASRKSPPEGAKQTPIIFLPVEFKFAALPSDGRQLTAVIDYYLENLQNDPESFYNRSLEDLLGKDKHRERQLKTFKYGFAVTLGFLLLALLTALFLKRQIYHKNKKLSENTDLLETEKQRRKQGEMDRNRLAAVIEQSSESIYICSPGRVIEWVNPAFETMTGYTSDEALGRLPDFIWCSDTPESVLQEMLHAIASGRSWNGRIVNLRKDGGRIVTETRLFPIFDDEGNVTNYVNIKRDVTNVSRMESELRQMQKLESIGTLAGGIAHDFNNMLSPIIGYTEMTLETLDPDGKGSSNLREVMKASLRAKALVEQILMFSRKTEESKKPLRIKHIVRETLALARASLPATIAIKPDLNDAEAIVMADPVQMHQVMMNLFTNAMHAMRIDGGTLTVVVDSQKIVTDEEMPQFELAAGRYCRITVHDTGHGMDRQTIARIFDPYFTTKATGEGTGIGLSVVLGIIKNHRGGIKVDSAPGEGTTFQLYLPEVDRQNEESARNLPKPEKGNRERILLVDDEAPIVSMYRHMLEELDYRVTARVSSVEALKVFESDPNRFDLLLTDLTMPNMTGIQLINRINAIRPDLPTILCTGFSEHITPMMVRSIRINAVLNKPLLKGELSHTIHQVLGTPVEGMVPHE
jgi:PAS domain S-box-containing protein